MSSIVLLGSDPLGMLARYRPDPVLKTGVRTLLLGGNRLGILEIVDEEEPWLGESSISACYLLRRVIARTCRPAWSLQIDTVRPWQIVEFPIKAIDAVDQAVANIGHRNRVGEINLLAGGKDVQGLKTEAFVGHMQFGLREDRIESIPDVLMGEIVVR